MRSVRDLLRDYNFVNTAEGRRNTVRFFAGFLALAAGGFMALFVAFGGGDPSDGAVQSEGDSEEDPFQVSAIRISSTEWYIGYPQELYDPDHRDKYSESEIQQELARWETGLDEMIRDTVEVRSEDEHDVLLGYNVHLSGSRFPGLSG